MKLDELRAQMKETLAKAEALIDAAEKESRNLNAAEETRWSDLMAEAGALEKRIEIERRTEVQGRGLPYGVKPIPDGGTDLGWTEQRTWQPGEVPFLAPEERMANLEQRALPDGIRAEDLSIGRMVRAAALGDWNLAQAELRAMGEVTGSAGGFLVPEPLSAQIIDRARNQARVLQAGARTIPMEAQKLNIGRVAGDPTAAWKTENAAGSDSDMTLERVTFDAKTLLAMTKVSVELIEDGQGIDQVIEDALASALALELDRVALRGTGTAPEPRGISTTTGVNLEVLAAALTSYDVFSNAVQDVAVSNHEPNAVILTARDAGVLDRLKDANLQPLTPLPSFVALRKLVTNQIPTNLGVGTNESEAYVGAWSNLLIGMRTTVRVEVTREAADSGSSAFKDLQVWIRAYLRADIALAQPSAFTLISRIIG